MKQESDIVEPEDNALLARLRALEAEKRKLEVRVQALLAENETLIGRIHKLVGELAAATNRDSQQVLSLEISRLQRQLADRNRELFGSTRSEKRPVTSTSEEPSPPEPSPKARKVRTEHGRKGQPRLPLRRQVHTLDEADLCCPDCGHDLRVMAGQFEEAEEVTVVRTRFELVVHQRQKYRCTCCDHIDTALGPPKLMPGSRYSPEFAVKVAVDKYADGLPLERQVERMERAGLDVTSTTLWDQLVGLYHLVLPTLRALHAWLLTQPVVHVDESPWRVMGKGKSARWWMWSVSTSAGVYYLLAPTRSSDAARVLLGDFQGVVVADAYAAYRAERARRAHEAVQGDLLGAPLAPAPDGGEARVELAARDLDLGNQSRLAEALDAIAGLFHLAGCWAHARRPFFHAEAHFPEVAVVLDHIAALYRIEAAAEADARSDVEAGADPDVALRARRKERRARESAPVIDRIRAWRKDQTPLPRSKFEDGVRYLRENWHALTRFLDNPDVPLDNSLAERAQRPTVQGRKIHLGSRSELGTRVAAAMYSLVQSARRVGVDPGDYLLAVVYTTLSDPRRQATLLPHDYAAQTRADSATQ